VSLSVSFNIFFINANDNVSYYHLLRGNCKVKEFIFEKRALMRENGLFVVDDDAETLESD